ncbi:MAG: prepilin peptidase [Halobacteriovoraceae bacterium]|jgi:prepilin signal peptidase PulO-like enzyme (type II secretory pathway)|nr:prepilin peptidase [Halobacteriovoraceae bacterium]MBT5093505.1 prepilin peptidase [Halobacteriovoraceae bacterium]
MDSEILIFYRGMALVFGSMIGSFLNVLIYRLPRDISFTLPRSRCPSCQTLIPWYQNIPILAFVLLRGRCFSCKNKISLIYPSVELLVGLFAFFTFPADFSFGAILSFTFFFSVFCVFITHFVIDFQHQILPNGLTLYLALVFLMYSCLAKPWTHWAIGGAVGFLFPLAVAWGYYLLKGREGLGAGDIKLYGALGIYLGPVGILQNIFFSSFVGSILGFGFIIFNKMDKNKPLPFGPSILIVAFVQIFYPQTFLEAAKLLGRAFTF